VERERTGRQFVAGERERVFSGMVAVGVWAEEEDTAAAGSNGRGAEQRSTSAVPR